MDKLEEELVALKASMAEEISEAVKKVAMDMQTPLTNQITTNIDLEITWLEGRIDRSRESQERLIVSIWLEQTKFHTEVNFSIPNLKSFILSKEPPSTHRREKPGEGGPANLGVLFRSGDGILFLTCHGGMDRVEDTNMDLGVAMAVVVWWGRLGGNNGGTGITEN